MGDTDGAGLIGFGAGGGPSTGVDGSNSMRERLAAIEHDRDA